MYPTLFHQERLIVNKIIYFLEDPKRNEIVVFRYPKDESRDFIKRVIAVGGDTVEMRDGAVLINGKKIDEPYTWKEDPKGLNHSNYRKSLVPNWNCVKALVYDVQHIPVTCNLQVSRQAAREASMALKEKAKKAAKNAKKGSNKA